MLWLHNARILAVLAVVALHATADTVTDNPVGSTEWLFANTIDSLVRWCVPVFVMMSGALLLDPSRQESLGDFYRKRVSRLCVPLVFWSGLYLLWAYVRGVVADNPPEAEELARRVMYGQPHYHLWYLYMIVLLYVFTPFFRKVVRHSTQQEVTVLAGTTFLLAALNAAAASAGMVDSRLFSNWFLNYVPYFFMGYLVRFGDYQPGQPALWIVFLLSVALTAAGCQALAAWHGIDTGLYFYGYLSVTVIPMSISIMYLLKRWNRPIGTERLTETLATLTLGIYLIHPMFLEAIPMAWPEVADISPLLRIPVTTAVVFALSLAAAWAISKTPQLKRTI